MTDYVNVLRDLLAAKADDGSELLTYDERVAMRAALDVLAPPPRERSNARFVSFFVEGLPISQGSKTLGKTKTGEAFMRESNAAKLTVWRRAVREEGRKHRVSWIRQSPLIVELKFILPGTRDCPVGWAPVVPDIDKLSRGVLDALKQGKVLVDDAQVVELLVAKVRGSNVGMWCYVRDAGDWRHELRFMDAQFHKEEPQ